MYLCVNIYVSLYIYVFGFFLPKSVIWKALTILLGKT